MPRLFIGVEVDEGLRSSLISVRKEITEWEPQTAREKWVRAENLHVTVRFLGNVAGGDIPALREALHREVRTLTSFDLPVIGIRAIPAVGRARMLWLALESERSWQQLSQRVDTACAAALSPLQAAGPNRPHVTLVRFRSPQECRLDVLTRAENVLPSSMSVASVTVFQSTLTHAGPIYRSLCRVALSAD